jgi:hypothetical protein
MENNNLPLYTIVELLARLSPFNAVIGEYKDHAVHDRGVIIKTTNGTIQLPKELILTQFHTPDQIGKHELEKAAITFKPNGKS